MTRLTGDIWKGHVGNDNDPYNTDDNHARSR